VWVGGGDLGMLYICLGRVCLLLGVGSGEVVVLLVAQRWRGGRMLWGIYVFFMRLCSLDYTAR